MEIKQKNYLLKYKIHSVYISSYDLLYASFFSSLEKMIVIMLHKNMSPLRTSTIFLKIETHGIKKHSIKQLNDDVQN